MHNEAAEGALIMSGQLKRLYVVRKKDIPGAVAVIREAFRDDPVWKEIFKDETKLDQKLDAFYETPLRYCLKYGKVFATSENLEGIAAWLPGEYAEITPCKMIFSGAIVPVIRMGSRMTKKMKPIFKPIQEDRKEHMEGRSFIYLQIIGVAPEHQGKGYGKDLLRAVIEDSEDAGLPVYLETETEDNVKMYERFGFRLIRLINIPAVNLPLWGMVRELNKDSQSSKR